MIVSEKIKNMLAVMFFLFIFFCSAKNIFCNSRFDHDYLNDGKNYDFNLPESYDARKEGFITPIKTQGKSGPCWAFGIISTLETNFLKENNLKREIDFSEMNMIFNLNKGASVNNLYEFDFDLTGNIEMASAYFSSGRGPVLEKDDKYEINYLPRDYKETQKKKPVKYIKKIIYIPDADKKDDLSLKNHRELIKKFVYEYGSVAASIYFDEKFLDDEFENYFYCGYGENCNHMVSIVGWDDNYLKDNFSRKNELPKKNGAFVVKNSWGQNGNNMGFFYVSYEDKLFAKNCCFMSDIVDMQEKYEFENIYQNDYFGMTSVIEKKMLDGKRYIANVFDLKSEKEALSEIGIFVAENNTRAKFFLLKVNEAGKIVGRSDFLCEKRFDLPGYYVIDLPEKILLEEKKFGVGIEFLGCNNFIACESRESLFSSRAIGEKNKNFYGDRYGFEDFYGKKSEFTNFCIKAFTEKNFYGAKKVDYKKFERQKKIKVKKNNKTEVDKKNKASKDNNFDLKKNIFMFVMIVLLLFSVLCIVIKYF